MDTDFELGDVIERKMSNGRIVNVIDGVLIHDAETIKLDPWRTSAWARRCFADAFPGFDVKNGVASTRVGLDDAVEKWSQRNKVNDEGRRLVYADDDSLDMFMLAEELGWAREMYIIGMYLVDFDKASMTFQAGGGKIELNTSESPGVFPPSEVTGSYIEKDGERKYVPADSWREAAAVSISTPRLLTFDEPNVSDKRHQVLNFSVPQLKGMVRNRARWQR